MADTTKTDTQRGRHDRVAMLSIAKNGEPAQHDPEIIGDKDFALAATKRQFAENAVSAVDDEKRREAAEAGVTGTPAAEGKQDPFIADLQKAHDSAAKSAEAQAEKVVKALHE